MEFIALRELYLDSSVNESKKQDEGFSPRSRIAKLSSLHNFHLGRASMSLRVLNTSLSTTTMDHFPTNWGRPVRSERDIMLSKTHMSSRETTPSMHTAPILSPNVLITPRMYSLPEFNTHSKLSLHS